MDFPLIEITDAARNMPRYLQEWVIETDGHLVW